MDYGSQMYQGFGIGYGGMLPGCGFAKSAWLELHEACDKKQISATNPCIDLVRFGTLLQYYRQNRASGQRRTSRKLYGLHSDVCVSSSVVGTTTVGKTARVVTIGQAVFHNGVSITGVLVAWGAS